jgi:hypothetical protein
MLTAPARNIIERVASVFDINRPDGDRRAGPRNSRIHLKSLMQGCEIAHAGIALVPW